MDDILIEELELGVRSYNCLKRAGIQTVGDLVSKTEGELNAIPNFGKKSIDEVIETLHARGLGLRNDKRGLTATPIHSPLTTHAPPASAIPTQPVLGAPQVAADEPLQRGHRARADQTSVTKAKAVKPELEKLITLGKRGDLHARRQALSALGQDKFAVYKLFEEIAPRYESAPAGTRGS